ncbi:cupin [Halococcus agarilyticus]|uniref:cupin n=1 Tax=Halococcus agarilyticus TaxID=1232219 RepID=UPI000677DB67|nr:cupin [Halococcus agarilyticus]
METTLIDDIDPVPSENDVDRRKLSGPLNTADVAINRYALAPGERFSGSLHAHMDQEEVFVIVDGEATFETYTPRSRAEAGRSSGEITVGENEAIRFAPGEFQSGKNASDEAVVAFAVGAPRDSEDVRVPLPCPECDHEARRPVVAEGSEVLVCPDCGAESPVECPECGRDDLRVVLDTDGKNVVNVCLDCGTKSTVA